MADETGTPPDTCSVNDLIARLETTHPGFAAALRAARTRLYERFPDEEERHRQILSHCSPVEFSRTAG